MIKQIIEPKYITVCDRCNTEVEFGDKITVNIYGYIREGNGYIEKVYHFHRECTSDINVLELLK